LEIFQKYWIRYILPQGVVAVDEMIKGRNEKIIILYYYTKRKTIRLKDVQTREIFFQRIYRSTMIMFKQDVNIYLGD